MNFCIHWTNYSFQKFINSSQKKEAVHILDCGSHIGLSILYFKNLFKNAIIKGFEPDNQNYELLNKNIQEWGFKGVSIEKAAVWTINGEVNFNQGSGMSSQINENETITTSQPTKCIRLKDCINEEIDFLKMDIEGAEYSVLMDAEAKLGMIKNIFIEYHGKFSENNKLVEILQLLERCGFQYYIKEAIENYKTPFYREEFNVAFEVQLNIFAFQKP